MLFDNQEAKEAFEKEFGQMTESQLWVLVKFAKHVRQRARNNSAFNNYVNRIFPYASFREVTKTKDDGTTYPGLDISIRE